MTDEQLRYPIGQYEPAEDINIVRVATEMAYLRSYPEQVRELVGDLSEEELSYRYRPEGWTIRQVVHHLPDSHTNAYLRFNLALTEDAPLIRPYREERWAELKASKIANIEPSLNFLAALHEKWVILLELSELEDLERLLLHPEVPEPQNLAYYLGKYVWHSQHHLAHIEQALEKQF